MVRPIRREPLAAQVEQILARRLRSGEFHPGDQLPAEHELADDLGVSRSTLRTAIGALSRQGLLVSRHGVGTFVSEASRIANHLTDAIDFHELIADGGATPSVVFDAAELVPAPANVAAALAIDEGATVHRCAKRFAADGETVVHAVISIATSVLGAELTDAVTADPTITEPLFEFFARRVGRATEYQLTSLRAVRGAEVPYPAQTFPADAAIIEMEETGFANDNRPIWHSVDWYPPGAMQFELVRRRPPGPT